MTEDDSRAYGARHLVTTTFEQPAPIEVASWPITLGIFWLAGIVPFYAYKNPI